MKQIEPIHIQLYFFGNISLDTPKPKKKKKKCVT